MSTLPSLSVRPKDAAALLGISLSTFWRWLANQKEMPQGMKLSRGVTVFDRDELLAWRNAHTTAGAQGGQK